MNLLEGSVEPNMGEEASGGGRSGEGRNQSELGLYQGPKSQDAE